MSRSTKITIVIVGLVAVLAVSHKLTGTTLEDLTAKKSGENSEAQDANHDAHGDAQKRVPLPKPMGTRGAPVKVKVYVTPDNTCDQTTLDGMKRISQKFGDGVYVEFADLLNKQVQREAEKVKIGCKSGITINGQSKFLLPQRGLKGAIMLDGPMGKMNYKMDDIEAIVQHLLTKAKQERKPKPASAKAKE